MLVGDSAGGNLSMSMAMKILEYGMLRLIHALSNTLHVHVGVHMWSCDVHVTSRGLFLCRSPSSRPDRDLLPNPQYNPLCVSFSFCQSL